MKPGYPLTFKEAVAQTPALGELVWQPGLPALGADSQHVQCSETQRLAGSVNLDEALKTRYPAEPRWDYALGWHRGSGEVAIWVEVHPAYTSEVEVVIRKLQWLRNWLATSAPVLDSLTKHEENPFFWLATGSVSITKNSPQARRLAKSGLRYPVRVLRLE
jgi:hypothetical protein